MSAPRSTGLAVLACGLGASVMLAWSAPWGGSTLLALGGLTGIWGSLMALAAVVLAARVPVIESRWGQTHALAVHRVVGPATAVLVTVHVVLTVLAYAGGLGAVVGTMVDVVLGTRWMLPATAGFVLLTALSLASWRRVRARMAYETWWAAHLYMYLAVVLAFGHELFAGVALPAGSAGRAAWVAAHGSVLIAVLTYRLGVPLIRSLRHRPVLESVASDGATLVVTVRARHLDELGLTGGQFMYWRILSRGLWWQAHPYSVLDASGDRIRLAVRAGGDYARALATSAPGTQLAFEGPYGVMTAAHADTRRVTLIGAGAGLVPLLGVAHELPADRHVRLLAAVRDHDPLLEQEIRDVVTACRESGGRTITPHVLRGPMTAESITPRWLDSLLPGVAGDDVYLCGPPPFTRAVTAALSALGTPAGRVHTEVFAT